MFPSSFRHVATYRNSNFYFFQAVPLAFAISQRRLGFAVAATFSTSAYKLAGFSNPPNSQKSLPAISRKKSDRSNVPANWTSSSPSIKNKFIDEIRHLSYHSRKRLLQSRVAAVILDVFDLVLQKVNLEKFDENEIYSLDEFLCILDLESSCRRRKLLERDVSLEETSFTKFWEFVLIEPRATTLYPNHQILLQVLNELDLGKDWTMLKNIFDKSDYVSPYLLKIPLEDYNDIVEAYIYYLKPDRRRCLSLRKYVEVLVTFG